MTTFTPKRILCVAAHPDDNEFCFAGSILQWIDAGAEVMYLICSDGSKGSKEVVDGAELASTRTQEQKDACACIGVQHCENLSYADGTLQNSIPQLKTDIVKAIRSFKPDTVLCMDPTFYYDAEVNYINHADHRAVGEATIDAVYPMARDPLYFPEQLDSGLAVHEVGNLLMFNSSSDNYQVDITNVFSKKVEAMCCHVSQVSDTVGLEQMMRTMAVHMANNTSYELAESFVKIKIHTSN